MDIGVVRHKRYKFIISDDAGTPILSFPHNVTSGKSLFDDAIISDSDTALIHKVIGSSRFDIKVLARDSRTGKAIIITPVLYPSMRVFAALFTDIEYTSACTVASESFSSLVFSSEEKGKLSRGYEKVYLALADALTLLNDVFADFSGGESFMRYLGRKAETAALVCGCEITTDIPIVTSSDAEDFDGGLLSMFLVACLFYAFSYSDMRKADVIFSRKEGRIAAKVVFPARNDRKLTRREAEKLKEEFYGVFAYIHSVCDRIGVPFSVIRDENITAEILPMKLDPSRLGLKVGFTRESAEDVIDILFC